MRKLDLIRDNERLRCRIEQLENILCPAKQHDFVELEREYVPGDSPDEIKTYRKVICKRCFHETWEVET